MALLKINIYICDISLPPPSIDRVFCVFKKAAICNETELHHVVVAFMRKRVPSNRVYPGLGEHQRTQKIRHVATARGTRKAYPILQYHVNMYHIRGFRSNSKHH